MPTRPPDRAIRATTSGCNCSSAFPIATCARINLREEEARTTGDPTENGASACRPRADLPGGTISSNTPTPEEPRQLSRIPRSSLFYFLLVAVLGIVFWFTWQSLESGSKGDTWDYSTLLTKADQGQLSKVDIRGSSATATAKDGSKHDVQLPDTGTDFLQQQLYKDNVAFSFQQASGGAYWISMLLPNLILLLLIGGFMYYILRQTQSGNNQAMSFGRSRA